MFCAAIYRRDAKPPQEEGMVIIMVIFEGYTPADGGVCAAKGFTAGGINAYIKKNSKKNDLAIIYCVKPCDAAALYTQNKVQGAPVTVTKKNLANKKAQAIVVNSGNANTCNGNGIEIAELMCSLTAKSLNLKAEDVIVASTGVIGQKLSAKPFEENIPVLSTCLSVMGSEDACKAIMTTDTRKKEFAVEFELDGKLCRIGGISKGSGMINPKMATMLCFITTDAVISGEMLDKALRLINNDTFNCVTVDGDTSTNDMVSIMASGLAGNRKITNEGEDFDVFCGGLFAVMTNLARETAKDGEGATKLIECVVKNAPDDETARKTAKSVVSSNLLKAAFFAADANCGRIMCAVGNTEADFDIGSIEVNLASAYGMLKVCENGMVVDYSEEEAHRLLSEDEITVFVDLHTNGNGCSVAWGCDLTYDYVKINAEYRS